ncbi:unnamed protein product, partial [Nippostrongylus brasiliensis]|uniref:SCP domain-containing protein n=1 Tax=Nippostrongylus brasiliensis TaxID=27835 RepID=A0A0N4Y1N9_NIPBR
RSSYNSSPNNCSSYHSSADNSSPNDRSANNCSPNDGSPHNSSPNNNSDNNNYYDNHPNNNNDNNNHYYYNNNEENYDYKCSPESISELALGRVAKNNGRLLPTAMNMRKVTYNCDLETSARDTANRCIESIASNLPSNVQQNILKFPQSAAPNRMDAIVYAIRHWWKQVHLVPGIGMKAIYRAKHQGTPIMSFIKMAWARTLTIGCAVSGKRICPPYWVAVCNYRVNPNDRSPYHSSPNNCSPNDRSPHNSSPNNNPDNNYYYDNHHQAYNNNNNNPDNNNYYDNYNQAHNNNNHDNNHYYYNNNEENYDYKCSSESISELALGRVAKNNGRLLPTAMNMRKVRYNCDLETSARDTANRCIESIASNLPSNVQQNILKFPQSAAPNRMDAIVYAIRHWWKQVHLVPGIGMKAIYRAKHQGTPIMSFIKMAWARTLTIGCAVSGKRICPPYWVAVCNYRVNGFVPETTVYEPGAVCSQCPGKTRCTMPEGLCTL